MVTTRISVIKSFIYLSLILFGQALLTLRVHLCLHPWSFCGLQTCLDRHSINLFIFDGLFFGPSGLSISVIFSLCPSSTGRQMKKLIHLYVTKILQILLSPESATAIIVYIIKGPLYTNNCNEQIKLSYSNYI